MAESYVYDRITDSIVASLEKGVDKWKRPWTVKAGATSPFPYNIESGAHYRGINVVMLWCAREEHDWPTMAFGTYDQWKAKGAQVRKGEKATHIVFFKKTIYTVQGENGDEERNSAIARGYTVFNEAQVDGYVPKPFVGLSEGERLAYADGFFAGTGSRLLHNGTRAFYMPSMDLIQMPDFDSFKEPSLYYSTLAHEHVHWTGAEHRLDRKLDHGRFGDKDYAFEELVAELGAAFMCAILNIDAEPREDHAQYIASWIKVLKNDRKAIFKAASLAQKAVDYLVSLQVEQTEEDKLAA